MPKLLLHLADTRLWISHPKLPGKLPDARVSCSWTLLDNRIQEPGEKPGKRAVIWTATGGRPNSAAAGAPNDLPDCWRVEARRSKARQSNQSQTRRSNAPAAHRRTDRGDGAGPSLYSGIEARCLKSMSADRARGAGTHIIYVWISLLSFRIMPIQ